MFDQSYFNDLVRSTLRNINEIWEPLTSEKLIGLPRLNTTTRDGRTFHVRVNLGEISNNDCIPLIVAYDAGTDESWLICLPFDRIERVEVFDSKLAAAGKKVSFETARAEERA